MQMESCLGCVSVITQTELYCYIYAQLISQDGEKDLVHAATDRRRSILDCRSNSKMHQSLPGLLVSRAWHLLHGTSIVSDSAVCASLLIAMHAKFSCFRGC